MDIGSFGWLLAFRPHRSRSTHGRGTVQIINAIANKPKDNFISCQLHHKFISCLFDQNHRLSMCQTTSFEEPKTFLVKRWKCSIIYIIYIMYICIYVYVLVVRMYYNIYIIYIYLHVYILEFNVMSYTILFTYNIFNFCWLGENVIWEYNMRI